MKSEIYAQKLLLNKIKAGQQIDQQLTLFLLPLTFTNNQEQPNICKLLLLDYYITNINIINANCKDNIHKINNQEAFIKSVTQYSKLFTEHTKTQQQKNIQKLSSLTPLFIKATLQTVQTIANISTNQKNVTIKCAQNIEQVNTLLRDIVLINMKLPRQLYLLSKQSIITLNGYMFNSTYGKVTHGFSKIHKGKVTSLHNIGDIQQAISLQKLNKIYSKSQLHKIVEQLRLINQNKQTQVQNNNQVQTQAQNFYHGQKYIKNSLNVLYPFCLDIQLMISVSNSQKNEIRTMALQQFSDSVKKNTYENVIILNMSNKVQKVHQQILLKVKQIIQQHNSKNSEYVALKNQMQCRFTRSSLGRKLCNPHNFLKTDKKEGFNLYYVKGIYEYFHYGDQSFNDQGWGCAYRSLQTLISWFQLQNYLKLISVPTIPEIQNIIDLIDYSSDTKLSNSSNWIGATQVSWVIKKLTNFDCRILHINDGKDIVQHAEAFRNHLQKVGTPIMYGGAEYAYSIVGINYNWKLGQIMFCILDPHYNGNDQVQKIIQKKGICWRKPQQMFKKGVFYNFCMPIV